MRNDEDIAKAAVNALEWDVWIPTGSVKVKVDDGWITLDGEVNYMYQRTAAENAVHNLTGVKGVFILDWQRCHRFQATSRSRVIAEQCAQQTRRFRQC